MESKELTSERFVSAYFKRIQYNGSKETTLKNLLTLHIQHLKHIPFENTFVLNNREIFLDKEFLYHKVIINGHGGCCYELNYLFFLLLQELGYAVDIYSASFYVLLERRFLPDGEHAFIIASIGDEKYVVDVGSLGRSAHEPVKLVLDTEFQQRNGIFRFVQVDNDYILYQSKVKVMIDIHSGKPIENSPCSDDTEWLDIYKFKLQPTTIDDHRFREYLFDINTNDLSLFKRFGHLVFILTDNGRVVLKGKVLTVYTFQENSTETRHKVDVDDENIKEIIQKYFKIPVV